MPYPKQIPAGPASPDEFDVFWYDLSIPPEILTKLKPYQRISQWPGIQVIAHKNRLGQNLMLMRKEFPEHYDFFPVTFVLPYEMNHFRKQFFKSAEADNKDPKSPEEDSQSTAATSTKQNQDGAQNEKASPQKDGGYQINLDLGVNGRERINERTMKRKPIIEKKVQLEHKMFIVKPESESQGKGIFLTNTWEDIPYGERLIAQQYIDPPYLIDGLKFDMRIYVLLYGVNPLRIYLFHDGLARFATAQYEAPSAANMKDVFMHLTNYSINKQNKEVFQQNVDDWGNDGHKRSLTQIYMDIVLKEGKKTGWPRVRELKRKIKDIIIKTIITGQPSL